LSDLLDLYKWRFLANRNRILEFQHYNLSRYGHFTLDQFVVKFLPKIPGGQTIQALYGTLGNLSSRLGNFVDPEIDPARSIVGLNNDNGFCTCVSITKHLQQPLGIAHQEQSSASGHRRCIWILHTRRKHLDAQDAIQEGILSSDNACQRTCSTKCNPHMHMRTR